jgi:putative selenate reductase
MDAVGARSIDEFVALAYGEAAADDGNEALSRNTNFYVRQASADPRYAWAGNQRLPKKVGSTLELFNCLTCDKCIPVCPNDANFMLVLPPREVAVQTLTKVDREWRVVSLDRIVLHTKHQIANFADFCNECGNCDIFCPEDGGPYVLKPRFFGSHDEWKKYKDHDGFYVHAHDGIQSVYGRFAAQEYHIDCQTDHVLYEGDDFVVTFDRDRIAASCAGKAAGDIDLTWFHIMDLVREAILESTDVNYANC